MSFNIALPFWKTSPIQLRIRVYKYLVLELFNPFGVYVYYIVLYNHLQFKNNIQKIIRYNLVTKFDY